MPLAVCSQTSEGRKLFAWLANCCRHMDVLCAS